MLKKLLLAVMLLGLLPGLANAWTITAKIASGSGSMTCNGTTVSSGTAYFNIASTSTSADVTVAPAGGYTVSQLVLDGVNIYQPGVSTYTVQYNSKNHTLYAYFSATTYSVTAAQSSGGVESAQVVAPTLGAISQGTISGIAYGSTVEIAASPNTNYMLTAINATKNGVTSTVWSGSSSTPVKYRYTVDGSYTYTSTFQLQPQATAYITVSTTSTEVNTPVVIDGSGSSTNDPPLSYSYAITTGDPSVVTMTPTTAGSNAAMNFMSTAAGNFVVRLTVTSARGATSTVDSQPITVMTPGVYDSQSCTSCHANRDPAVYSAYISSPHGTGGQSVSCSSCHNPGNDLAHPYNIRPVDVCKSCHTSFPLGLAGHQAVIGTDLCVNCHDQHSTAASKFTGVQAPHYNNVTSGAYPASYMSSQSACSNCHSPSNDTVALNDVRKSWGGSKHAATTDPAWTVQDFKTQNTCVRCHTRTGFLAYSTYQVTAAWGSASDKTKEILACNGCHRQDFTVRVLVPYSSASAFTFRIDAANTVSIPYKNLDYGPSNVCVTCHGGTTSGEIIKRAFGFANFTAAGRLTNHFMVGAGVMDNSIGYEFDGTPSGRDIDFNRQNTWHSGIGLPSSVYDTGSFGPCVTCHMSAPGNEHSYKTVFKNLTGAITSVAAAPTCAKCHPSSMGGGEEMTPQAITQHKSDYSASLDALKELLKAKGFDVDNPSGITSWGSTTLQKANNMGAFYNYFLLRRNDVAGYVHNPTYAKRLIQYSIDWLDNQVFDDSDYTAINMLQIPQATKDAAISYLGVSTSGAVPNCYSCHQAYYNN